MAISIGYRRARYISATITKTRVEPTHLLTNTSDSSDAPLCAGSSVFRISTSTTCRQFVLRAYREARSRR
ncbi:hypothetical protein ABID25_005926 [Mesorhizobium abyssinicae]